MECSRDKAMRALCSPMAHSNKNKEKFAIFFSAIGLCIDKLPLDVNRRSVSIEIMNRKRAVTDLDPAPRLKGGEDKAKPVGGYARIRRDKYRGAIAQSSGAHRESLKR